MIAVTESNSGSREPRVVARENPVVKPINLFPADALAGTQASDAESFFNLDADEEPAIEEEGAGSLGAFELTTQLTPPSTQGPATRASFPPGAPSTKLCLACGNEIPVAAKFCNKCGKSL